MQPQPHPSRRFIVFNGLAATFTFVCALTAPERASARERYTDFVNRLAGSPPPGIRFDGSLERRLLSLVNGARKAAGLRTLANNGRYHAAARAHAADLLLRNRMEHSAGTGHGFESRMKALNPGMLFLPRLGENAARVRRAKLSDSEKLADVVKQWKNSSSHRQQMLSRDYLSVATGIAKRDGVLYAVQIFAGPEIRSNLQTAPEVEGLY